MSLSTWLNRKDTDELKQLGPFVNHYIKQILEY